MKNLKLSAPKTMSAVFLATASSVALSQSSSLDAHVHGEAELMIAIESTSIEMQFVSPAANIYGFEHEPATDEQLDAVARAQDVFSHSGELFVFEGANCGLSEVELDLPYVELVAAASHNEHEHEEHHEEHGHEEHHEEHAHEEHEHEDHHDEHVHEEHAHEDHHDKHAHEEHEHEEHHEDHETHSEITASLVYECDSADVSAISVAYMSKFPTIESMDVQWISSTGQGAKELSAGDTRIELR